MNSKSAVVGGSVAAVRARWVEALRSGRYRQGDGRLRRLDGSFCCLGVGCDVLGVEWRSEEQWGCYSAVGVVSTYDGKDAMNYLDNRTERALGLNSEQAVALANMNDDGKTFAEIADYIESLPLPAAKKVG